MNILTTMITPYKKDGSVDYTTAEKYVDFYFDSGIDGIFAVCQSSEIFFLTLEERVELNRRVYARAKELERTSGRRFTVVSSGHISDTIDDQAKELNAVYESGTDALILITNRLDINNEGDDVFIANADCQAAPRGKAGILRMSLSLQASGYSQNTRLGIVNGQILLYEGYLL